LIKPFALTVASIETPKDVSTDLLEDAWSEKLASDLEKKRSDEM
jgi:hypothetical protein